MRIPLWRGIQCCACEQGMNVLQSRVSSGYLSMPCNRVRAARRTGKCDPLAPYEEAGSADVPGNTLPACPRDEHGRACCMRDRKRQGNRLGHPRPSTIYLTRLAGLSG